MASEKLIYASAARKAILKADPKLAYVIDNVPAVDAVEVVRCKDCQFLDTEGCPMKGISWDVQLDDFCSYGERREGE